MKKVKNSKLAACNIVVGAGTGKCRVHGLTAFTERGKCRKCTESSYGAGDVIATSRRRSIEDHQERMRAREEGWL